MSEDTQAVINATVYRLADDLALLIAVAVDRHPEALRIALAKVFDTEAITEHAKKGWELAQKSYEQGRHARESVQDLHEAIEKLHERLDSYTEREGRMSLQAMEERIELLEAQLQPEER